MWNAMGHCYQQEQLGLLDAAVRCHRRALPYDKEGVAVHELVRGRVTTQLAERGRLPTWRAPPPRRLCSTAPSLLRPAAARHRPPLAGAALHPARAPCCLATGR